MIVVHRGKKTCVGGDNCLGGQITSCVWRHSLGTGEEELTICGAEGAKKAARWELLRKADGSRVTRPTGGQARRKGGPVRPSPQGLPQLRAGRRRGWAQRVAGQRGRGGRGGGGRYGSGAERKQSARNGIWQMIDPQSIVWIVWNAYSTGA